MLELINSLDENRSSLRATYERCQADASVALSCLQFEGPLDATSLNALANLALTSTIDGDYERTTTYLDGVLLQADCPPPIMAKALLASDRAQVTQKGTLQRCLLEDHASRFLKVNGLKHSAVISALAAACAEHGLHPEQWIDAYDLPPDLAWDVQVEHDQLVAHDASKFHRHGAEQAALYTYANYLGDSGEDLDAEVHERTLSLLGSVPDPETRIRLTERFVEATERTSYAALKTGSVEGDLRASYLSTKSLNELLATSMAIIQNPLLATPDNIVVLDGQIKLAMQDYFVQQQPTNEIQLWIQTWQLLVLQAFDATAEDLANYALLQTNEQISALEKVAAGKNVPPEKMLDFKEYFQERRYYNLMLLGVQYAQKGEFSNAKACVAGIENEILLEHAFYGCLNAAQNISHIEEFEPDPLTMSFNPTLAIYLEASRARFCQDPNKAYNKVYELADNLAIKIKDDGESPSQIEKKGFELLYGTLQNLTASEQEQIDFLDTALTTLRQGHKVPYHSAVMNMLSRATLSLGSHNEAAKAYDYINTFSKENPAWVLGGMSALAANITRTLRERDQYLFDYLA